MDVFDLLDRTKKDSASLLHNEKSLKALRAFLAGYEIGASDYGNKTSFFGQLRPFNEWLAIKLSFSNSTSGWCNMILSKTKSDEQAFDMFFDLLDKYRKEKK